MQTISDEFFVMEISISLSGMIINKIITIWTLKPHRHGLLQWNERIEIIQNFEQRYSFQYFLRLTWQITDLIVFNFSNKVGMFFLMTFNLKVLAIHWCNFEPSEASRTLKVAVRVRVLAELFWVCRSPCWACPSDDVRARSPPTVASSWRFPEPACTALNYFRNSTSALFPTGCCCCYCCSRNSGPDQK